MSETCPNCGSRKDMFHSNLGDNGYVQYVCRYAADKDEEWTSETCDLIRSLREELAEARDAERDRIAGWIEAQGGTMSEIPDNGQCKHGQWRCEMCGLEETAKAIRSNEHRSEA